MKAWKVVPLLSLLIPMTAMAEDSACNALLRQGVYDHFREFTKTAQESRIRNEICEAYQSYQKDVAGGNVQASYGLFSGSASASAESIEQLGKSMCSLNSSDAAANSLVEKSASVIHDTALQSFVECRKTEGVGLKVATDFREDPELNGGVGFVGLTLSYRPDVGIEERPQIFGWEVIPKDSLSCSGTLTSVKPGTPFSANAVDLNCQRVVNKTPSKVLDGANERLFYAPSATVVVKTGTGPVRRHLLAIAPAPKPEPTRDPIGAVIAYPGPVADDGTLPTNWMLCDGSPLRKADYPELFALIGTRYGNGRDPVTGQKKAGFDFNLPDYRGYFLRGRDGRLIGDPVDKDRGDRRDPTNGSTIGAAIGSIQSSAVAKHKHPAAQSALMPWSPSTSGDNGVQRGPHWSDVDAVGISNPDNENGASETRPTNIYVDWLIRVQ